MRSRLAYVPEDRYGAGSVASMSLADNYLLTNCAPYTRSGFLDSPLAAKATERAIQDFRIRAVGPRARAGSLSGGNLQKLILARELGRDPNLFIAEQPTQGLDVAATEDIWQALLAQRARSAVLLVTGDLREALSLADRVAVMFRGRILETVDVRDGEAVGRVGLLMAGVREEAAHAG
jgi:simple sugar transport system ATP-binding protein